MLCVALDDPMFNQFFSLSEIRRRSHYLREVEHFFEVYKELEGKKTEILGWRDVERAHKIINECIARYAESEAVLRNS